MPPFNIHLMPIDLMSLESFESYTDFKIYLLYCLSPIIDRGNLTLTRLFLTLYLVLFYLILV